MRVNDSSFVCAEGDGEEEGGYDGADDGVLQAERAKGLDHVSQHISPAGMKHPPVSSLEHVWPVYNQSFLDLPPRKLSKACSISYLPPPCHTAILSCHHHEYSVSYGKLENCQNHALLPLADPSVLQGVCPALPPRRVLRDLYVTVQATSVCHSGSHYRSSRLKTRSRLRTEVGHLLGRKTVHWRGDWSWRSSIVCRYWRDCMHKFQGSSM